MIKFHIVLPPGYPIHHAQSVTEMSHVTCISNAPGCQISDHIPVSPPWLVPTKAEREFRLLRLLRCLQRRFEVNASDRLQLIA